MRRKLIVGNWKLNGSLNWIPELANAVKTFGRQIDSVDIVLCPPNVYIQHLYSILETEKTVSLGAQDVSEHCSGAYTGEVAAAMLRELCCEFVIVGHSERRKYHSESDQCIAAKAKSVLESQMTPIVCVGETLEQRQAGMTREVVESQLEAVVETVESQLEKIAIAYEPVWAIGTGNVATPEQAQEVHGWIRKYISRSNHEAANHCRILYGGSVKGDNASAVLSQSDVDGCLVGGASLNSAEFLEICRAAS